MFRAIINTVGTSLLGNFMRHTGEKELNREKIKKFMNSIPEQEISAEINALSKLKDLNINSDYLYFLTSDSDEGQLCAELIGGYYNEKGFNFVDYKRVTGLVKDFKKFKTVGLINLVNILCDLIEEYKKNVIINATGGYKAEIAYATLVGILYKVKVIYIHEDFKGMIEMPFLPINFDFNLWNKHKDHVDNILNAQTKKEARNTIDKLPPEFGLLFQKDQYGEKYILSPPGEAIDRINKFALKQRPAEIPVQTYKSHSTLWGDSIHSIADIPDKDVRIILMRICKILDNVIVFKLEEMENRKSKEPTHFDFIEKRKGWLKYKIKTKTGAQYIDINVIEGTENMAREMLGSRLYP